uniref:Uncharacterized protein n=1 Tax=Peronospora matthiolae TaxID=2874970 RepID=A0AAV1V5N5_9STRA
MRRGWEDEQQQQPLLLAALGPDINSSHDDSTKKEGERATSFVSEHVESCDMRRSTTCRIYYRNRIATVSVRHRVRRARFTWQNLPFCHDWTTKEVVASSTTPFVSSKQMLDKDRGWGGRSIGPPVFALPQDTESRPRPLHVMFTRQVQD